MGKCLYCSQETKNPKYCSKSCANTVNSGLLRRRMQPQGACKICSCAILSRLLFYCKSCKENKRRLAEEQEPKRNCVKVIQWRRDVKRKLVALRGGKCEICGYDKCLRALQFHHKNPAEKKFAISQSNTRNFASMVSEIEKCDLLCANCHAEVENKRFLERDRNR